MSAWFRKHPYRWGWQPTTWQGWMIFSCALIGVILASWIVEDVVVFVVVLVAIVSALTSVSWLFSERS